MQHYSEIEIDSIHKIYKSSDGKMIFHRFYCQYHTMGTGYDRYDDPNGEPVSSGKMVVTPTETSIRYKTAELEFWFDMKSLPESENKWIIEYSDSCGDIGKVVDEIEYSCLRTYISGTISKAPIPRTENAIKLCTQSLLILLKT